MGEQTQVGLRLKDQRGITAILVGVVMVVLLGFVALAVDIGYVMVTRNELQNISDGAALAAARKLGSIYEPMSYAAQQNYVCNPSDIIPVAQEVAQNNQAAGMNITVNANDVIIGRWDGATKTLSPTLNQPDAVRVISRRDGVANGPISTFFANFLGISSLDVQAGATAALTGQSTAGPGGLPVPFGISRAWFDNRPAFNFCNQPIRFYPTNDPSSCAGWNVYDLPRYNDNELRNTIAELENGTYQSPATNAGETQFSFGGGTMSTPTFLAMKSLFDSRKGLNDGIIDSDNDPNTWTTSVAVYESSDCGNPTGLITIVGFATIVITGVQDAPVKQIDGYVICDAVEPGRGSGGNYGTQGSIPGLVQ